MAILRLLTLSTLLTLIAANNATYRRVCYYTNWSQTVPAAGKFEPEDINPYHCTHICYAFAKLDGNHIAPTYPNDESRPWMKGLYERTLNLKKINPSLKILISLGGWDMGSAPFTAMVANAANRKDFIDHAITWMRKRGFDGLDIDWEYPANRGSPPEDKNRFSMLIKEARQAFEAEAKRSGKDRLLLISAVPTAKYAVDSGYDVATLSKYFDFFVVMTYDFHGTWESFTGHNSPLFVRADEQALQRTRNTEWTIDYWIHLGAAPEKLNIGLPTYGRGFTLASKTNICLMIQSGGKVFWIEEQKVPYVVKGDQWYGYENPKSLKLKVEWMKSRGLGGIAVWALPLDDFSGMCGEKYPLMKALLEALGGNVNSTSQRTTTPTEPPDVVTLSPSKDSELCRGTADGIYPYPKSCTKYVVCINENAFVDKCEAGFWNRKWKQCDSKPDSQCTQRMNTTKSLNATTPTPGKILITEGIEAMAYPVVMGRSVPKVGAQYGRMVKTFELQERNSGFDLVIKRCYVITMCRFPTKISLSMVKLEVVYKTTTMISLRLLVIFALCSVGCQAYRRVCYHTNWSQYRPAGGKYFPESIDPTLCTHICYAFAKLNGNHLHAFEWNDESEPWMKGMYNLNAICFFYLQETKLAFEAEAKSTGNERLLLACAVSAGQDKIDTGYDIPEISKYFDFITIMTYDLHGAWEKFTGHNSPLHVRSDEKGLQRHLNVEWAANYWVKKGAPKSILNVGLALYGRGFTLSNPAQSNPGDPAKGASNKGPFTREGGFLSYYEICKMIATGGKVSWIKDQEVPYVVKGNQWVGYDNPKSLTIKVNWIKANGFGGIAVWALPLDDFNGQCGGEKYPLMKSIVRALGDKIVVPPHTAPVKTTPKTVITLPPKKDDVLCQGKPDGTYSHPKSCTEYVFCVNGRSFIEKCKVGLWNQNKGLCDPDPSFRCTIGGKVVTNKPSTSRPVTPGKGGSTHFCEGKSDGLYVDPKDCTFYYQCSFGLTFHERCGPKTGYDPKIKACNFVAQIPGCS
ncbi:probable chitinase 10 [Octopus bimaculoides]|uniref:probable chitinase 10 n=1 Tax=Octopus bimaculoides TaxID=37653 RepID=UPI0022E8813F|nr:probable chitinase 10 [Octopus bimaculoides]